VQLTTNTVWCQNHQACTRENRDKIDNQHHNDSAPGMSSMENFKQRKLVVISQGFEPCCLPILQKDLQLSCFCDGGPSTRTEKLTWLTLVHLTSRAYNSNSNNLQWQKQIKELSVRLAAYLDKLHSNPELNLSSHGLGRCPLLELHNSIYCAVSEKTL
jgi:hypothetical protein